jgi:hypothetical protein
MKCSPTKLNETKTEEGTPSDNDQALHAAQYHTEKKRGGHEGGGRKRKEGWREQKEGRRRTRTRKDDEGGRGDEREMRRMIGR